MAIIFAILVGSGFALVGVGMLLLALVGVPIHISLGPMP